MNRVLTVALAVLRVVAIAAALVVMSAGSATADVCKQTQIMTSAPQPVYGPEDYEYQKTWQKIGTTTEVVGAGTPYTVQEWQQVPVQTTSWVDRGSYQTRWAQTGTETYSYQVPYTATGTAWTTCSRQEARQSCSTTWTVQVTGSWVYGYAGSFYSNSWSSPCGKPGYCGYVQTFQNVPVTTCNTWYETVYYACSYTYTYTAYRTEWATRATYGWLPFWVSNWQQVTTTTNEYQWVDVTRYGTGTTVTYDVYDYVEDRSLPMVLSATAVPNSYTAAVYDIKTICDLNPT